MFTHIAIDWGQKRSGLAFGNSQSGLIIPYLFDLETEELLQILEEQITQKKVEQIVIGLPTNFKLKPTLVTFQIQDFIKILNKKFVALKIQTINERNSSKTGKQILGTKADKYNLNHQAACQILQNYFEKNFAKN